MIKMQKQKLTEPCMTSIKNIKTKSSHLIFEVTRNGLWIRYKNDIPIDFVTLSTLENMIATIKELRAENQ